MRIVIALGGNALLQRGEPPTPEAQRRNVQRAVDALAPLATRHALVITHGNGPQVGLLAQQAALAGAAEAFPLDVLDAETEGMIGYLIEQELSARLGGNPPCATLLTQIEVDPADPAFRRPSKPIGPVMPEAQACELARLRGWQVAPEGSGYRRVVASPRPKRILELAVIELLVAQGVVVICAGGGGIPVVRRPNGSHVGVEAVIDKDLASSLLARELSAGALLMLTDVEAVYSDWGLPGARRLRTASPAALRQFTFAPGSMGPKVQAACEFVEACGGAAGVGRLSDAAAILAGEAGTLITREARETQWWD